jgi:hypothetical protein
MTKTQRLRRVLYLCCRFAANQTYYRLTRRKTATFWRTIRENSYDVCALEWCKLFGDSNDPHYWKSAVTDSAVFERELMRELRPITANEFQSYVRAMRRYRDKFVAHLDSDLVMLQPNLGAAWTAVQCYYAYVFANEIKKPTRCSFPDSLDRHSRDHQYDVLDLLNAFPARSQRR